jgi:hypothetical protein
LFGNLENNPANGFNLRALPNTPEAFCIGRNNVYINFDLSNCTQNTTNATMCAVASLINSTDCKEDYAFRFNRIREDDLAIESVKLPAHFIYFNVENCRGIMNHLGDNATNVNTTAQQRCGRVEIWDIPNLAAMIDTNENLKNALFDIIRETGATGAGRTIPIVPL